MEAKTYFENHKLMFIKQVKEWTEIIINIETKNKYAVLDERGTEIGFLAEESSGLWAMLKRWLFRSHRPFEIKVWDNKRDPLLQLTRPFFWFFSDLLVRDAKGRVLGHVFRRFGLLYKKYDLCDANGKVFAQIKAPIWNLWTFRIYVPDSDRELGQISKKWGGIIKEIFTDSDKFGVNLEKFTSEQRPVVFAAAISIDFDFFEDNHDN